MGRVVLAGLRGRLLLLVSLVLLPAVALVVASGLEQRRAAVAQIERQAQALARIVADEHEERMLHESHQLLRLLAALPEVARHDSRACSALFADLVRLYERYAEIGAATANGDVFCSAQPLVRTVNIAGRSYFRGAIATRGFAAGEYQTGRFTGKAVLVLAHAVVDRRGGVRAVVFAGLDLAQLRAFPPGAQFPEGSVVATVDRGGRLLARHPGDQGLVGMVVRDSPLLQTVLAQREGVTRARGIDGVARLVGFAPVRGLNGAEYAYVWVGIPHRVAYAEANRVLERNLIALALVGLLAFGLAWVGGDLLLLRGVRALLAGTRRLMAGDLGARASLPAGQGELAQLSRALAGMAEALQSRATAVEQAEAARRVTEEELAGEHEFMSAVLDVVGALVIVLDRDGRILRLNRACEVTTGYTVDEVRGIPFWDRFLDRDDVAPGKAMFEALQRGTGPAVHETVWITRDGRRRLIAWSNTVLRDRQGTVEYVIATGIDISERKRVEDELQRNEATARAFLEFAAEGVLVVDASGAITLANAQAQRIFGYQREALLGLPIEILVPERLRDVHVQHRARYHANPRILPMGSRHTLVGRRQDGSEFPVEIGLSFIETKEGLRVMAFVADITERLAMQQRSRQTEKLAALGTLSAGIAHEVNNPIGIITTRTELMLGEPDLPPAISDDLRVVHRQALRVARIAHSLLSFARQSPGRHEPVRLNDIVKDTVALIEAQMRKDRIRVGLALDPALPAILGDSTGLQQVVLNLLTNAWEAMTGGGAIRIETGPARRPGWIRVTVADTGPGIPVEALPKIFDPFFTTKSGGTGLGLSVSYGIVRDHHGSIEVESEPGVETRFIVSLPVLRESVAGTAADEEPERPSPT